jgi:flagellar hook assembly protein FlgD
MRSAIGGGPLLVANGKPVFRARESFGDPVLNNRAARSAVAQLSDGRVLLVTVEGGGVSYSAGMTNYELAVAMVRLGARTAMGLGTGTSAAMAFDGTLLTRAAEQPIADALMLSYSGVYAAPPGSTTLSPNGDGVDDQETFTYKLVRPSQVTATVVGPGGAVTTLAQDAEQPGLHTLQWDGKGAVEGGWRFSVSATDDLGHATTAERQFALNETLASLQVAPRAAGLTANFQLAHAATVTVTVEKANGIVLATLLSKKLDPGPQSVTWTGRPASGSVVRVVAVNSIGKATLVSPLSSRRS